MRLDKGEAFRGILRMKDQDPVKIQLSFRRRIKSNLEPEEEIKQFLDSLENGLGDPTDYDGC